MDICGGYLPHDSIYQVTEDTGGNVAITRNLIHDPQHTLDGMLVLRCFFCKTFQTKIEYDMKVHLLHKHGWNCLHTCL
jgi:hypothetical protein